MEIFSTRKLLNSQRVRTQYFQGNGGMRNTRVKWERLKRHAKGYKWKSMNGDIRRIIKISESYRFLSSRTDMCIRLVRYRIHRYPTKYRQPRTKKFACVHATGICIKYNTLYLRNKIRPPSAMLSRKKMNRLAMKHEYCQSKSNGNCEMTAQGMNRGYDRWTNFFDVGCECYESDMGNVARRMGQNFVQYFSFMRYYYFSLPPSPKVMMLILIITALRKINFIVYRG